MNKFQVGELWADHAGLPPQRIVAITDHPVNPRVVTMCVESGDICDYDTEGRHVSKDNRRFDLTRQIVSDPIMASVELCKAPDRWNGMDTLNNERNN